MAYKKELETAKTAALLAGEAIMRVYNQAEYDRDALQLQYKEDASPLTLADKASHEVITWLLGEEFPEYGILSEEADSHEQCPQQFVFVVDPLDGTKEFVKRNGQFTVNIALAKDGVAVMGVIYVPATKVLYWAAEGEGAWMVDVSKLDAGSDQGRIALHVSDRTEDLRAVASSSHACAELDDLLARHQITRLVRCGSSIKGCMVASGEADIYFRHNPTCEWDTAAMQCIAEQAGAIVRQMDDTPLIYNRKNHLNDKGFYIINRIENRLR